MKAKFVNEDSRSFYDKKPFGNNPGQTEVDAENARLAAGYDEEEYWKDVADAMGGEIYMFDTGNELREIAIKLGNDTIEIIHNWRYDGSPTKPVTTINGENLGRFSIWPDPSDTAEDYLDTLADLDESGVTGMKL